MNSVAVIGGGIIGLSVAWRLAQQGFEVSVFDKASIGGEASWAGAGMLSPGGEVDKNTQLASLALESRAMYSPFVRELESASNTAIDYQDCGALDLAYSQAELHDLESRATRQLQLGIASRVVALNQISSFWPRVRMDGLQGGRFYPGDGIVNPREVLAALTVACTQLGVSIFQDCPVEWIEIDAGDAVISAKPEIRFQAVVVAAGAWSSSIAVRGAPALPGSEPVKGHLIAYQQPAQTCSTILRHGHWYFLQRAGGSLLAGASVERVGFDRTIAIERVRELVAAASFVLPHLAETAPTEQWIGFRPGSDSLHIGPWHSKRLHLAYGHYRNGILLAPVTAGRIAAELTSSLRTR